MLTEPREALPRFSTYKLAAAQPALIDLTTVYQNKATRPLTRGIYSLQSGVLTYCISAPGRPRPADFTATKGDGHTLVVLRRSRLSPILPMNKSAGVLAFGGRRPAEPEASKKADPAPNADEKAGQLRKKAIARRDLARSAFDGYLA